MTDLNKGLFIHSKLKPFQQTEAKRFCRILGVSVYTTQMKTKPLTIAYKVGYWDTEPKTEEDFNHFTLYRSEKNKNIIHVFTTDLTDTSLDNLNNECIKDFLGQAEQNTEIKILSDEIDNLYFCDTKVYMKSKVVTDAAATAWNIIHKLHYESTDGLYPQLIESSVKFRGNFYKRNNPVFDWKYDKNDFIKINLDWTRDLSKSVLEHLDSNDTIQFCDDNFIRI